MKRLLLLALPALLLAPAHAAGDGCPPETCGVQSTALPGSACGRDATAGDLPGLRRPHGEASVHPPERNAVRRRARRLVGGRRAQKYGAAAL